MKCNYLISSCSFSPSMSIERSVPLFRISGWLFMNLLDTLRYCSGGLEIDIKDFALKLLPLKKELKNLLLLLPLLSKRSKITFPMNFFVLNSKLTIGNT